MCIGVWSKPSGGFRPHHRKERGVPTKYGAARKQERTTGRKYAGADGDKEPEPGEREQFWVSGYTRADGKQVEGYYKKNPAYEGVVS